MNSYLKLKISHSLGRTKNEANLLKPTDYQFYSSKSKIICKNNIINYKNNKTTYNYGGQLLHASQFAYLFILFS